MFKLIEYTESRDYTPVNAIISYLKDKTSNINWHEPVQGINNVGTYSINIQQVGPSAEFYLPFFDLSKDSTPIKAIGQKDNMMIMITGDTVLFFHMDFSSPITQFPYSNKDELINILNEFDPMHAHDNPAAYNGMYSHAFSLLQYGLVNAALSCVTNAINLGVSENGSIKYDGGMQYQLYILDLVLMEYLGNKEHYENGLTNLQMLSGNTRNGILLHIQEMKSNLPVKTMDAPLVNDQSFKPIHPK